MYAFNAQAARQADERTARIDQPGPATGVFTRAEHVTSRNGATGIDFAFETGDRRVANFTIWTLNREGNETYGMKQLSALMACIGARQLADPQVLKVKKYDRDAGGVVEIGAPCFPELMNKPIGVLFETEDYEKTKNGQPTGETGLRAVAAGFYRAADNLMAGEILDRKTTSTQLGKFTATLKHKPLRQRAANSASHAANGGGHGGPQGGGFDSMDDDIPF